MEGGITNRLSIKEFFSFKGILLSLLILFLLPKKLFIEPGLGVDASWQEAINMALNEKLVWGKDIIFTYGPLGYLSTNLPDHASKLMIVLFHLFISLNAVYFLLYLYRNFSKKSELILLTLGFLVIGKFLFLTDTITLFFFSLFHIFHFLKHHNKLSFFIVSISSILAFYIKVNAGIILNIVFLLFILYALLFPVMDRWKTVVLASAHYVLLWGLSFLLNTHFFEYILNSFPIIDAYNDAMVLVPDWFEFTFGMLIVLTLIYFTSRSFKGIFKSHFEFFLWLNVAMIFYITFKQSFVRADIHLDTFFKGITFILILVYLFTTQNSTKQHAYLPIVLCISISIGFLIKKPVERRFNKPSHPMIIANSSSGPYDKLNARRLPERIRSEIGNASVDLLGSETSFIFFNDLNYSPRPIIQSYSAYSPKLIDINSKKYKSTDGPEFILYHLGSIDDRNPFWDEPKTYLSLLTNYFLKDSFSTVSTYGFNRLLLFKRSEKNISIHQKTIFDTIVHFNEEIKIPESNNILFLEMECEYTLLGKARRILYQPSLAYMDLFFEDETHISTRVVLPVMRSGVPINKKVLTDDDAYNFFKSSGNDNIRATKFVIKGDETWINGTIKLKFVEYILNE